MMKVHGTQLRSTLGLFVLLLLVILTQISVSTAQFPAPVVDDDYTTVQSPVDGNVTIKFRSPLVGTCTTVFTTQKQYSGYIVRQPLQNGSTSLNYTSNTFFWFIEARQTPEIAPLTIFINGGPGSSSMVGLFQEVGPCTVIELAQDRLGTIPRDWGWDRSSNIVFIDQPVQVGFSYDSRVNASLNLLNEQEYFPATSVPATQPPYTFLNGTFSSGNPAQTANTSQLAAESIWHFLQAFLATFPQYDPYTSNGTTRTTGGLHLFTESYGGKYGPAAAAYFRQQNLRRQTDAAFANSTLKLNIDTLGIMNGWVDLLVQTPFYPRFAYNNTYGIQAISQLTEINTLNAYTEANGCQQQTLMCRAQEAGLDPDEDGNNTYLNNLCSTAQSTCQNDVIGVYTASGRSIYDISQPLLDPFPNLLYLEYLNTKDVQNSIGVSVNYTQTALSVATAFNDTGDYVRGGILQDLIDTLAAGTRVALIYGDRDYICNWLGGEALSFAIAGGAGPSYQGWHNAGYAPIVTNNSYIGGVVREFGNLSFSRIYDAGHLVPAYQPDTAFTVFSRLIKGTGVSLGKEVNLTSYGSGGDANSTHKNQAPAAANPVCFVRAVNSTCTTDQKNILANHDGYIINGVLYNNEADWQAPEASVIASAGSPGEGPQSVISTSSAAISVSLSNTSATNSASTSSTSSQTVPTGVYTATGIPTVSSTSTRNAAATGVTSSDVLANHDTLSAILVAFGLWTWGVV